MIHPDPDLRAAIHVRDEVYQAQGMVMVDLGVTLEVALARMRASAFAEGLSLQAARRGHRGRPTRPPPGGHPMTLDTSQRSTNGGAARAATLTEGASTP